MAHPGSSKLWSTGERPAGGRARIEFPDFVEENGVRERFTLGPAFYRAPVNRTKAISPYIPAYAAAGASFAILLRTRGLSTKKARIAAMMSNAQVM
jgi:hypothetical protein